MCEGLSTTSTCMFHAPSASRKETSGGPGAGWARSHHGPGPGKGQTRHPAGPSFLPFTTHASAAAQPMVPAHRRWRPSTRVHCRPPAVPCPRTTPSRCDCPPSHRPICSQLPPSNRALASHSPRYITLHLVASSPAVLPPGSHGIAPAARICCLRCPNHVLHRHDDVRTRLRRRPGHGGAAGATRGARLACVGTARCLLGPACLRRGRLFPTSRWMAAASGRSSHEPIIG